MKRRLVKLGLFLLLGAILNIAVAWGCACRIQLKDPMARFVGESVLIVSDEGPLSTLSHDLGIVDTWRTSRAMGITWACPIKLLNAADFEKRLPGWSALKHSLLPNRACAAYGLNVDAVDLSEFGTGWPAISLCGASVSEQFPGQKSRVGLLDLPLKDSNRNRSVDVPFWPVWPGFSINTLFYAAILWLLFATPFALRRRRRIKRGLCPACAYPVGMSNVCTECGKRVAPRPTVGVSR